MTMCPSTAGFKVHVLRTIVAIDTTEEKNRQRYYDGKCEQTRRAVKIGILGPVYGRLKFTIHNIGITSYALKSTCTYAQSYIPLFSNSYVTSSLSTFHSCSHPTSLNININFNNYNGAWTSSGQLNVLIKCCVLAL